MSDTLPQATRSTVSNPLSARSPLLREQAYTLALEIHILPLRLNISLRCAAVYSYSGSHRFKPHIAHHFVSNQTGA